MATRARLTDGPIDVSAFLEGVASTSDGAVLLFVGIVRDHNDGRAVGHLEYDAYAAMAEREMERIAAEAERRYEVGRVSLVHRTGRLEIGEASVAIAVAAPHRGDAYAASRYVVEALKNRVPIWKREGYVGGDARWLAGQVAGG